MREKNVTRTIINVSLVLVLIWIFFVPVLLTRALVPDNNGIEILKGILVLVGPLVALFLLNFYILCPKLFFAKGRMKWFFVTNLAIILVWRLVSVVKMSSIPESVLTNETMQEYASDSVMGIFFIVRWGIVLYHVFLLLVQVLVVSVALALRYLVHSSDMRMAMEIQRRNNVEAELSWLKNQLNPHFMFNTLNNISALAAIDPDKTQDSIAQLSDVLRYVLYETNKDTVPVESEVQFMNDYIDLMKMRYNDKVRIDVDMDIPSGDAQIAPLLFITLVENAFKHGVSASAGGVISITMSSEGEDLLFACQNSLHEKPKTDMSGSGIGLQNMTKRLELIYPGKYDFSYGPDGDMYVSELRIRQIFGARK